MLVLRPAQMLCVHAAEGELTMDGQHTSSRHYCHACCYIGNIGKAAHWMRLHNVSLLWTNNAVPVAGSATVKPAS